MSWFKRTKDPYVTDDYLQTAETVSRPMAIIYTIIMVFVVGALAFSIFFGGRWLYQHLDGTNKPKITVVENPITTTPENGQATSSASTTNSGTSSSSTGSNTSSATTGSTTGSASTTTNASTSTTSSASNQNTTTTASSIPATGPTDVAAVFIITTICAALLHNLYLRRKTSM